MIEKKPLSVGYATGRRYGETARSILAIIGSFDPKIHEKIEITILSTNEVKELNKAITKLSHFHPDHHKTWSAEKGEVCKEDCPKCIIEKALLND